MTQGKFNTQKHVENAYAKVKENCKPANARKCGAAGMPTSWRIDQPPRRPTDDGDG